MSTASRPATSRSAPAARSTEYLITWEADGRERNAVWRAGRSLPLGHPARWLLRRTTDGIFALRVERYGTGYRARRAVAIPPHAIAHGSPVVLPESETGEITEADWQVRLRPLRPIPAPYDPPRADGSEPLSASHESFLYCGLGDNLLTYRRVGTKFKIHVEKELVFTYAHQFPGHVLAAAVPGVTLTLPDGRVRELPVRRPATLTEEEWRHGKLTWGKHWWRITPVPLIEQFGLDARAPETEPDDARLSRFAQWVAIGTACLVFVLLALPHASPVKREILRTEVKLKPPKYLPKSEPEPPVAAEPPPQGPLAPYRGAGPGDAPVTRAPAEPPPRGPDSPARETGAASRPESSFPRAAENAPRPVAPRATEAPRPDSRALTPSEMESPPARSDRSRSLEPPESDDVEVVELEVESEYRRPRPEPRWDVPTPRPEERRNHTITARSSGRGSDVSDHLEVTGVGRIEKSDIQRTLERHLSAFQDCYRKALAKDPKTQGIVEIAWTIGTDGATSNIGVAQTDIKDPGLVACISDELRAVTFPRPRGGAVQVKFPIVFSPTGF